MPDADTRRRLDAADATVEAVIYSFRQHGAAALLDSSCRDRLADL